VRAHNKRRSGQYPERLCGMHKVAGKQAG